MNGRVFSFGSSGNPLVQILSLLVFAVLLARGRLIMGAVVIALVILGLAVRSLAIVLVGRVWWLRRKFRGRPPFDGGYRAAGPAGAGRHAAHRRRVRGCGSSPTQTTDAAQRGNRGALVTRWQHLRFKSDRATPTPAPAVDPGHRLRDRHARPRILLRAAAVDDDPLRSSRGYGRHRRAKIRRSANVGRRRAEVLADFLQECGRRRRRRCHLRGPQQAHGADRRGARRPARTCLSRRVIRRTSSLISAT